MKYHEKLKVGESRPGSMKARHSFIAVSADVAWAGARPPIVAELRVDMSRQPSRMWLVISRTATRGNPQGNPHTSTGVREK